MAKAKKSSIKKNSPMFVVLCVILFVYVVALFSPLLWAVITSFKEPTLEWSLNPVGIPWSFIGKPTITSTGEFFGVFDNYIRIFNNFYVSTDAFGNVYFPMLIVNSLLYAVGSGIVQTTVTFIVAYAAARFKFFIGKVIYFTVILGMILPIVGAQPSMLAVARQLGMWDNFPGMFIQKANYLGMYFLVFHATLSAFPKDYDEAAQIDGANNLTVMVKIMFPLSITTFCTILLLYFIKDWNDYTTPMLFMPSWPTLAYGLRTLEGRTALGDEVDFSNPASMMAACIVVAIPTLVLFMIFHDRLLNNVSIGGVKE